ncbi:hypothetical protein KEM60_01451 [Austwickia sp. TVS 96-490-7B]|uniref:glycosyltransferase family 2 protein n=1 Tax=Austwickia sp. TVS 96-490-7B TaxID=2830843 RepID=UPI001C57572C|nr:glycosyltransferase family A protein [Austwickia sp. TVS 96-490-7B]MBW3085254.1 hypothetical protein [Austwickia sp. TVS 96-490-7B]
MTFPDDMSSALPTVSAVVGTHDRPVLLRRAVTSILEQDYPGTIECIVVRDRCQDDLSMTDLPPGRSVIVVDNVRSPGLAGARNTGINRASGELIAFCDDDDEWLPGKISVQVEMLSQHPEASLVATGIRIVTADDAVTRIPPAQVTLPDLLRSRVAQIHPSSFLLRRDDLIAAGLVDEEVPSSFGEDYELMLRLARRGPIVSVTAPLTVVHWDRLSFFSTRWNGICDGLGYILTKFPEFNSDRVGRARLRGQIAFAHAAAHRRRDATRWAAATLRDDPRQLRGYAALAVATGLVPPQALLERVNAHGRGL